LLLTVGVVVTAAASAAAGVATAWGLGDFAVHLVSIGVGALLGWGYILAAFRVATPAQVPTNWMLPGAAVSAVAWQLLLTAAGVIVAHLLRHAQAVAGLFGLVLGLLRGSDCKRQWWYTPSKPMWFGPSISGLAA
jgi:membrane protein